ncbi:MAG: DUF2798 domain-containing protein [Pseudomonadota bacterium]
MIPHRFAHVAFALIVSGLMSCMVSGISTFRTLGMVDGFVGLWLTNWPFSWAVAFPTILVVAPCARRIVGACTIKDDTTEDDGQPAKAA